MIVPESSPQGPLVLETRRLVLEPLAPTEVAAMRCICNAREVGRFLFDGETVSTEAIGALIGRSERDFLGGSVGLFGIRRRGAEGLIGFCGFFVVEGVGEPELSYALIPSCWGRGYATEAALAVVGRALDEAGFRRVLVATEDANAASVRVIERLGAEPLGRIMPAFPEVDYFEVGAGREGGRWPR